MIRFQPLRSDELSDVLGFAARIFAAVREANDGGLRDPAANEIALFEFGDAGVGAQVPAAGDYARRPSGFHEFSGARGAIGLIVVIAQNHDGVRSDRIIVDDPEVRGHAHQRMPHNVKKEKHHYECDQKQKAEENSSALRGGGAVRASETADHFDGSRFRRRSAAVSGRMPLK
jgi:hypothetical protein